MRAIRGELKPMLALSGPVILAELGWVAMALVDTFIVGRLGPEAIGAVGIGSSLFMALAIFGMGLLLGLDTLVSHAYGAGRLDECHLWLLHGLWLSALVAPPLLLALTAGTEWLHVWGFPREVLQLAVPYLRILNWSLLPLLVYASCRRYLQAMGIVAPVTFALISANLINAAFNWLLVFGHLGLPALGTTGSAWATLLSRIYMAAVLVMTIVYLEATRRLGLARVRWAVEWSRLRALVKLGFPAAAQVTLELGVFSAATALAGRLDAISLAAHQIVLNLASLTFMMPLGMSSAAAVRVGHAVGRQDREAAIRAGSTALGLGVLFMALASLVFLMYPVPLLRSFTSDARVVGTGVSLLVVAAAFQPFDGLQGVATGVLRGIGDTRTPMLTNLGAHWLCGLPLGYVLCFVWGRGVIGLWVGLASGLTLLGIVLLAVCVRRAGPAPSVASSSGR